MCFYEEFNASTNLNFFETWYNNISKTLLDINYYEYDYSLTKILLNDFEFHNYIIQSIIFILHCRQSRVLHLYKMS